MDTITTIQNLLKLNGSARPVTVNLTESERHLIAAAPDMYEALVIAMEFIENLGMNSEKGTAALAKARGES